MYTYKLLFFIIWEEFLEGISSRQSQMKSVICEVLIKGHEENLHNETIL